MAAWLDPHLEQLAKQLAYSPADKRTAQLASAEQLLNQVDPSKDYPWEFLIFRLTGFRPKEILQHNISGEVLRADLSRLVEFLSDTLSIRVADLNEPVLSLEEITKQFSVSSKTIQRWRRQGLIAQRFVYPDGRRRIGFVQSSVEQFARANNERVKRSAMFRQLTSRERDIIVKWSRRLAKRCQCCIKEISKRLSRKLGRSPETIRYVIRRYDREHPDTPIFTGATEPLRNNDRQIIMACFDRGVSVDCLAKRYCRTRSSIYRVVTQERAERIKGLRIEFVTNPLFDHPDADNIILNVLPREAQAKSQVAAPATLIPAIPGSRPQGGGDPLQRTPQNLPPYLAEIFKQPVLHPETATDLFRRMNFLKAKASRMQAMLDVDDAKVTDLAEIESLLDQARLIKNELVQAHLRVVVHVARKHLRAGMDLMELVSDGTVWIMRAVEKFDFARGVKFATYASYAVMKNFARGRVEQIARPDRRSVTGQEELLHQIGDRETPTLAEQLDLTHLRAELTLAIRGLSPRERELLTAHYGLDETQAPLSLSQLGEKMGITKARVQQLETRALRKLRQLLESQQLSRPTVAA